MSLLDKYLAGWSFRTSTPTFEVGEEIDVYLTGQRNGTATARVGDTILRVEGAPPGKVDDRVRLRVEEFDANEHRGRATFVETIDGE
ncbi:MULTISPECIES: hypothetical protein [unclassified Haladaptatus]|uniref:DUF7513 family protein n=1 Tax=unclassified Haladaptatus TaxID=2622732 RepID=UPI00209BD239|nr:MULTISPECIES: hypothetical protein [unclassified Haladaptatus]MCO8244420.1 hypothetical protein [Haladaptatus sp. AB643]MCO8253957.1 hypothetical protein [Haladaptatus sp. AB618]